jgi:chorismate dehydratase
VTAAAVGSLRVGCVKYLNARPLIHGWSGAVVFDHPAALCAQLEADELDVALVSSFELFRQSACAIVDGVAIASECGRSNWIRRQSHRSIFFGAC